MRTIIHSIAPVALTLCIGACQLDTTQAESANEAVDAVEAASTEGALLAVASSDVAGNMTAEQAAKAAASSAGMRLSPAGCVTATANGARVNYKLTRCSGPYGLVQVTGSMDVLFKIAGGTVTVEASAVGLRANSAVIDIAASGTWSDAGGKRQLVITTSGEGTGARGTSITRGGTYTAGWDGTCYTLDGSWSTTIAARSWSTVVAGYKHCTGMCPAAGGTVTWSSGRGTSMTITFDGDATASWTTSDGRTGTVLVSCGN